MVFYLFVHIYRIPKEEECISYTALQINVKARSMLRDNECLSIHVNHICDIIDIIGVTYIFF